MSIKKAIERAYRGLQSILKKYDQFTNCIFKSLESKCCLFRISRLEFSILIFLIFPLDKNKNICSTVYIKVKFVKIACSKNFKSRISNLKSGFTLIELLVVIAILGILSAVLLVGINPLEQVKRGRDSSRKNVVAQLGHAMESYLTSQSTGGSSIPSYPPNSTTWMSTLQSNNEIKVLATVPELPPAGTGGDCPSSSMQSGTNICYSSLDSTTAVIWTFLESDQSNKVCSSGNVAAAAWISSQGKTGIACLSSTTDVPSSATTLY